MSRRGLARHNAQRDTNEPELRKRFAAHGWHTEQVSGKGMPDLLCMKAVRHFGQARSTPTIILVDVKMPNGKLKPAQEKKWAELRANGIPVYVVRTEADVDALVRGALEPWRPPDECTCEDDEVPFCAVHVEAPRHSAHPTPARVKGKPKPSANSSRASNREPPVTIRTRLGPTVRKPSPNYTTPQGSRTWPMATTAVVPMKEDAAVASATLAAQEAEEAVAPEPMPLQEALETGVDRAERESMQRAMGRRRRGP